MNNSSNRHPMIDTYGSYIRLLLGGIDPRGAIHTHGIAFLEKSIDELIQNNTIRADLPNPELEPELYQKVLAHQIHHCQAHHCGGPPAPGERCSKGFSQPLSNHTYEDENTLRYIYKRTKEEDRWVVPYHPPILLLWNAHICFQYVTSAHLQKKKIRVHGTNLLLLLLSSSERIRSIKPIYILQQEDENVDPYWSDAVDKYFERPVNSIFDEITYSIQDLQTIIENQLMHLMKSISPFALHAPLYQPSDQYQVYTILERYWGKMEDKKHPYFFLTGSASTGKTFMIFQIIELLKQRNQNYILMVPTGVATENIGGKTIHSTLRIKDILNNSDLFAKLHKKLIEFGGIPILLIRDLAQLPPVKGAQVFFSPVWKICFPLFLTFSRRQQNDLPFYSSLQNVRFGIITDDDKKMIFENVKQPSTVSTPLETTFITGFKHLVHNLNATIASQLLSLQPNQSPLISIAIDYYNDEPINTDELIKCLTSIQIIRVKVLNESLIEVVFPISTGMVIMKVEKDTAYFVINGSSARRTQFSLQNAFSLTVHKTQGLTLPHITVSLDTSMFAYGQTYVTMSRATSWQTLDITYFDLISIKANKKMIKEYERLQEENRTKLRKYLIDINFI
ncbi:hypothetical protein RclHR1_11310003 [Rhizophagus clarus]|uniref:ATP-dependent DNA helicase n=1 Tax=Rhizophagus clarus TaxID=94130 RepID=A0A2Z6QWY4_9GLOM|nr:hypothetical protein RclHR1_11310003 [Rhizophagus clarus]